MKCLIAALLSALIAAAAGAQENPLTSDSRSTYSGVRKIMLRTAELTPEETYAFKPVDSVRTFGQILGHVADAQYYFCSAVIGEKHPGLRIEKTKTSKAELIAALTDAFAYCEKAYDSMSDQSAAQAVKFMGGEKPKLGVLSVNQTHTIEHYGNLVTYMRIKGIVPPTSDPDFMKTLASK